MKIDIATKVMGLNEDVYVVRPGEDYWAYELMRRSSRIFLDFPDLQVDFKAKLPSDAKLRLHIARSIELRDWYDNDSTGPAPSDQISDFVGAASGKRLGKYVGAIKRLYADLPIGTTIVVPGEGYFGEVLIGEISSGVLPHRWSKVYDGDEILTRKVKWARSKARGTFSDELRALLGKPTPVMQLDRSLRREILLAGYDQFSFEDEYSARLNTEEDDFNTLDDYSIQSFLNYVTGILIAIEQGQTEKVSFASAIEFVRANPERAMELKLNINSRGFQRLLDKSVVPLAAVALVTAAIMPADSGSGSPQTEQIEIVNSRTADEDDCTIRVAERVANARDLMLVEDWERLCRDMRQVKESTGISTTMSVKDPDE